jgi:hypothetical protein
MLSRYKKVFDKNDVSFTTNKKIFINLIQALKADYNNKSKSNNF